MTDVVTENCIKCKSMDSVEVCPADADAWNGAPGKAAELSPAPRQE